MSLDRFEAMMPVDLVDASDQFAMIELDSFTNLSDEYGPRVELNDSISIAAPSNWNPDQFVINIFGIPTFANTDGNRHIFHVAFGDADNYVMISKEANDDIRGRVRYHGKNYDATLTYPFSVNDNIFISFRLDGIDSQAILYADTDDDGTLETAQTAEKVGHFYPEKDSGRLRLNTDDQGLRFVKSSGRVHIEDGSPAGGLVALLQRNGRFKLAEPA